MEWVTKHDGMIHRRTERRKSSSRQHGARKGNEDWAGSAVEVQSRVPYRFARVARSSPQNGWTRHVQAKLSKQARWSRGEVRQKTGVPCVQEVRQGPTRIAMPSSTSNVHISTLLFKDRSSSKFPKGLGCWRRRMIGSVAVKLVCHT